MRSIPSRQSFPAATDFTRPNEMRITVCCRSAVRGIPCERGYAKGIGPPSKMVRMPARIRKTHSAPPRRIAREDRATRHRRPSVAGICRCRSARDRGEPDRAARDLACRENRHRGHPETGKLPVGPKAPTAAGALPAGASPRRKAAGRRRPRQRRSTGSNSRRWRDIESSSAENVDCREPPRSGERRVPGCRKRAGRPEAA